MSQPPALFTSQDHSHPPAFQCLLNKTNKGQPLSHRWETAALLHPHPNIESRQVFVRAGKLHHGALLIRSLDAVTYRTTLSDGPRGSGYELEVLNCPLFGVTLPA